LETADVSSRKVYILLIFFSKESLEITEVFFKVSSEIIDVFL